jgi:hypothetical protein
MKRDHTKPVLLQTNVTESQAEWLQKRVSLLPFKVQYQEEQHGSALAAVIACTNAQEKTVRELLQELGAAIVEQHADGETS